LRKHPLAQMLLIGAVASVIGVAIALSIDWFPPLAADKVGEIDTLYDVLLIVSVPIFVLVMTVAIYSVVKFRAKPGDLSDGAPIHGNTRLEIIWVSIPFLLVTALAAYGWVVLHNVEASPAAMTVKVRGQQFTWHFTYEGPNGKPVTSDVLYLPNKERVKFDITTNDVIHSFWVPQFRLKQDAVPGMTTHIKITPNKVGTYDVVCAELCGLGHSTMRNTVRVVEKPAFTAWLARQARGPQQQAQAPAGGAAPQGGGGGNANAAGKQVFASNGCGGCHTLSDAGTSGAVGPKLDDLAAAAAKFGKQNNETAAQYVKQSIVDPRAFVVPGFQPVMPTDFKDRISGAQLDALVKYLLSVSGGKAGSG